MKKEREECTFKPTITEMPKIEFAEPKPSGHIKTSSSKPSQDRCHDLYELSKKIVKKEDKPTDEYYLEKEKTEYTFAPQINKEKIIEEPGPVAPLTEETIERLKKAREEHERIRKNMERGAIESGMRFDNEGGKFKKSELKAAASGSGKKKMESSAKKEGSKKKSPRPVEPAEENLETAMENVKNLEKEFMSAQKKSEKKEETKAQ